MPQRALDALLRDPRTRVLSLDVFDTVLLRDSSTETERMYQAAVGAADELGVDAESLARLRWLSHDNAYRVVAMERPGGDARFAQMCAATVALLGLGADAAEALRRKELEVDAAHLRPHTQLLDVIDRTRSARPDLRIIAVSDIYYSAHDIRTLLRSVVGRDPFDAIYTSGDLDATKRDGGIFGHVARREQQQPDAFVHAGDTRGADVREPRAAGWRSTHLPASTHAEAARILGRIRSIALKRRRVA